MVVPEIADAACLVQELGHRRQILGLEPDVNGDRFVILPRRVRPRVGTFAQLLLKVEPLLRKVLVVPGPRLAVLDQPLAQPRDARPDQAVHPHAFAVFEEAQWDLHPLVSLL
eukprot:205010-Rhodomonas_salina.1